MSQELTLKKRKLNKTVELYLTPVLNIFLNIVPLLLMTAVFIQTSVINLSLPSQPANFAAAQNPAERISEEKQEKLLILSIAAGGFYLILGDKLLKIIPTGPKGKDYDFDKLEVILRKLKESFPQQQSIIIESEDSIIYDHLIHTMDRCRACGLVNIILSAGQG